MEYTMNNEIYIEDEPLMTIADVAAALSLSTATLYEWRTRGDHPLMNDKAIQLGAHSPRWRRSDVNDWIAGLLNH